MEYHEFPEAYFGKKPKKVRELTAAEVEATAARFKQPLISFIKKLPKNAKLLDVGCGSGKAIQMVRAFRPDVRIFGTDITDTSEYLPEGVEFKKGSAENLPEMYAADSFDAVICQHVIEHLLYPMPLALGIRAVLKPGGKVYIETPNWTRMFTPFAHYFFWNDYTHVRIFSPFALRKLFLEHGFSVDMIKTVPSSYFFPPRQVTSKSGAGPDNKKSVSTNSIALARSYTITRIFARLVTPFIRDILIGVATKQNPNS